MRIVEVTPYCREWGMLAETEIHRLQTVIGEIVVSIEHIGSTAVPGLAAKPVIDLLGETRDIGSMEVCDPVLKNLGYTALGEYGIPGRRYYYRQENSRHTHHLHVFASGDIGLKRHLALRDYLRAHPREAAEYGALKLELAWRFHHDIQGYMAGKAQFVQNLERRALKWQDRVQTPS